MNSTTAVRNFGELLAEVKHGGHEVVIMRGGKAVARIGPAGPPATATLRDLVEIWNSGRRTAPDPGFAEDLEKIQRADKPPRI